MNKRTLSEIFGVSERTLTEWQALFAQSGMTLSDDVRLRSFAHMLVLRPTQQ